MRSDIPVGLVHRVSKRVVVPHGERHLHRGNHQRGGSDTREYEFHHGYAPAPVPIHAHVYITFIFTVRVMVNLPDSKPGIGIICGVV